MTDCVVKEDHRTRVAIQPWSHGDPVNMLIRAGTKATLVDKGEDTCSVKIFYLQHVVKAQLPIRVIQL
jgi:hypothetical protein